MIRESQPKWTPGPWIIVTEFHRLKVRGGVRDVAVWIEDYEARRGEQVRYCGFGTHELANARLIAKAPQMYAMLDELWARNDQSGIADWAPIWDEVRDLLAEARGEA